MMLSRDLCESVQTSTVVCCNAYSHDEPGGMGLLVHAEYM